MKLKRLKRLICYQDIDDVMKHCAGHNNLFQVHMSLHDNINRAINQRDRYAVLYISLIYQHFFTSPVQCAISKASCDTNYNRSELNKSP